MNQKLLLKLEKFVKQIEARARAEKVILMVLVLSGLVMAYLPLFYDPLQAAQGNIDRQKASVTRQIQDQQVLYAQKQAESQQDPNKFANDRLAVIRAEQQQLDLDIEILAGDLISPNDMTRILTTVLERQEGLELISVENKVANPLRSGLPNTAQVLAERGTVNLNSVPGSISGQVYEHSLVLEFQGDFFNTLKYLRFLEQISAGFFWDSVKFSQLEWPQALITLEIHTLSTDEGFIGV